MSSKITLAATPFLVLVFIFTGCKDPSPTAKKENEPDTTKVIGETTRKIGEFNPEDGKQVSDGKMRSTNPLNPMGAMNAYKPIVGKLMKLKIEAALKYYYAEKGRYPKNFEEFQTGVMDRWVDTPLAVLPGGWVYEYDVKNHELVILKDKNSGNSPRK